MRIPALALMALLVTVSASAQTIHVPDLAVLGLAGAVPEPAEIDGNPNTLEFVVMATFGFGESRMVNPAKTVNGLPCIEPIPNPLPLPGEWLFVQQTTRFVSGKTYLLTWGENMVTGEHPYDIRPLRFIECK